jgi:uncharacterized membrane protein YbhN (UPF0104 family)
VTVSRSAVWRWARIAVAFGLIGFLGYRAGVGALLGGEASLDWRLVVVAAAIVPFSLAIRAFNHALLLNRPTKVLSFAQAYRLVLVGAGMGLVVPMGASDMAKAHWGWRIHGNAEAMVVSAVLDKLTSLTAVAAMGLVGALMTGSAMIACLSGALLIASVMPFLAPRAVPWHLALRFLAPGTQPDPDLIAHVSKPDAARLILVYGVSTVGWVITFVPLWLCCLAAGVGTTPAQILTIGPVSSVARLIPISVAGLGVGEVTLAALLTRAGFATDAAARAVLLYMVLMVLAPGAAGLILVARGRSATETKSTR